MTARWQDGPARSARWGLGRSRPKRAATELSDSERAELKRIVAGWGAA